MSESDTSGDSGRGRHRLLVPLSIVGGIGAAALLLYDPNALLLVLGVAIAAYLLHLLAARVTEADLLIPFLTAFACVAIGVLYFARDYDVVRGIGDHLPASVKGLFFSAEPGVAPADVPPTKAPGGNRAAGAPPRPLIGSGDAGPRASGSSASVGDSATTAPTLQPGDRLTSALSPQESVTLTLASGAATIRAGEAVRLSVLVRAKEGTASCDRLQLFDGASRIATAPASPEGNGCSAVFAIGSLGVGTHKLTARYDGAHGSASSNALSLTVLPEG